MQDSLIDIKNRILTNLIKLYLIYKTKILNMYTYLKTRYITNVDHIRGTNSYGVQCNLFWRFCLISMINKSIQYLSYIKKYYDIPCKIIEVKNNYYDKVDTTLYTPSENNDSILLSSVINVNKPSISSHEQKKITRIFSQFSLVNGNDTVCLKNYLIKYRDDNGLYNHSLDNILKINNQAQTSSLTRKDEETKENNTNIDASTNADDQMLNITFFEKAKKKTYQVPYKFVKNNHINYFYNSDFIDVQVD